MRLLYVRYPKPISIKDKCLLKNYNKQEKKAYFAFSLTKIFSFFKVLSFFKFLLRFRSEALAFLGGKAGV